MQQVEIFSVKNDTSKLKQDMNDWLRQMGETIEITRTIMAASGRLDHYITITIFYKVLPK